MNWRTANLVLLFALSTVATRGAAQSLPGVANPGLEPIPECPMPVQRLEPASTMPVRPLDGVERYPMKIVPPSCYNPLDLTRAGDSDNEVEARSLSRPLWRSRRMQALQFDLPTLQTPTLKFDPPRMQLRLGPFGALPPKN